jgi:trigger factor
MKLKRNKNHWKSKLKKRIKTGLILNAFGEENKINVSQEEINVEIQKQFRMMPGQEKIVKDYYEQNPAAIDSLRGQIYEEKIIEEIKKNAKTTKKEITKEEAEKILKQENENNIKEQAKLVKKDGDEKNKKKKDPKKKEVKAKSKETKKTKTPASKPKKAKKVSKK